MDLICKSPIPYKNPKTENLIEFLKENLNSNSEKTIIIDGESDRKWTGSELKKAIFGVAKSLKDEYSLNKGDVCSLYSTESDMAAIIILANICAGATCNFILEASPADLFCTYNATNSKFLISSIKYLPDLVKEFRDNNQKVFFISIDEPYEGCPSLKHLLSKDSKDCEPDTVDYLIRSIPINPEKDFAVIQFSSGTTGKPKPIPRTHKNLCHLVASVDHPELVDLKEGEIITGNLALGYRPGLWALLACIKSGATFVIDTVLGNVDVCLGLIEKYKVTQFALSISNMNKLAVKESDYDLSSIKRMMTSGGSIVNPDIPRKIVEKFKLKSFRQCFGMTESGWVFLIEERQAKDMYSTVGRVVPGMEAIVINHETGERLGSNQRGEIALRGPQIFPGYLINGEEGFNRSDFTEDGWFKIGDEAYYDDEGLFHIVGRYKEMMQLSNSYRYYPDQIEATISQYEEIASVCVVKVPRSDDSCYDSARAYVILKPNSTITEQDIKEYIKKTPLILLEGGIRIVESFPRLKNGKINKRELSELP